MCRCVKRRSGRRWPCTRSCRAWSCSTARSVTSASRRSIQRTDRLTSWTWSCSGGRARSKGDRGCRLVALTLQPGTKCRRWMSQRRTPSWRASIRGVASAVTAMFAASCRSCRRWIRTRRSVMLFRYVAGRIAWILVIVFRDTTWLISLRRRQ